jgi:hypothetical protein
MQSRTQILLLVFVAGMGRSLPQPIDIRGIAKDPVSGKPIPGLVVMLESKKLRDTTDENGAFRLTNMDKAKKLSPLRKLYFSSERGFAMQMGETEEVIAEIVNGAGRAILRGQFNLDEGGWSLRPKNLAPGLYTVHLWTGSQLRALRLDIPSTERNGGAPGWNLEKIPDGDYSAWGSSIVDSLRVDNPDYQPAAVPVASWTQLRVTIEPKPKVASAH